VMMSGVSPETCWAIKKQWNNKFYYTISSCWFFLWDLYYDARIMNIRHVVSSFRPENHCGLSRTGATINGPEYIETPMEDILQTRLCAHNTHHSTWCRQQFFGSLLFFTHTQFHFIAPPLCSSNTPAFCIIPFSTHIPELFSLPTF